MSAGLPFKQTWAAGLDGEAAIGGYVADATDALYNDCGIDACQASHAIDFALAIVLRHSDDERNAVEHLSYVVNELNRVLANMRKELI